MAATNTTSLRIARPITATIYKQKSNQGPVTTSNEFITQFVPFKHPHSVDNTCVELCTPKKRLVAPQVPAALWFFLDRVAPTPVCGPTFRVCCCLADAC